MNKGKQSLYSRSSRQWVTVTVHRAGNFTSPNNIHISNGYMVGTNGFPVPALRLIEADGTEVWRGVGSYNATSRPTYKEGDQIQARIKDLSQISAFYIRYNQVKELPFDLGLLVNTRTIGLRMNYIQNLGWLNLENLHLLQNLDLSGNTSVTGVTISPQAPINFFYLHNTSITQANLDTLIELTVARGITGGTMMYNGRPSYDQWQNYDTLVARGWSMSLSPLAGTTEILGFTQAGASGAVNITASHRITFTARNADGTLRHTGAYSGVHPGGSDWTFAEDGWIETTYYHPTILSMVLDGKRLKTVALAQYINIISLNLDNNFISTVVLTSNTKLESLRLRYNPLTSVSGVGSTKLNFLDLRDTGLTGAGISSILGNLVTAAQLNGTFHYSVTPNSDGVTAYNTLISRGWTLSIAPVMGATVLPDVIGYEIAMLEPTVVIPVATNATVVMDTIGYNLTQNDAVAVIPAPAGGLFTIRPDADTSVGDWTVAPLWPKVSDQNAATFISSTNANGSTATLNLNEPSGATSGSANDGILRFTARKGAGSSNPSLDVQLRNGTTALATFSQIVSTTAWTEYTISTPSILTPDMNLNVFMTRSGGGGPSARAAIEISEISLQVEISSATNDVIPVGTQIFDTSLLDPEVIGVENFIYDLVGTSPNQTTIFLDWNDISGAEYYKTELEMLVGGNLIWGELETGIFVSEATYTGENWSVGQQYRFRVVAFRQGVWLVPSEPVTVTIQETATVVNVSVDAGIQFYSINQVSPSVEAIVNEPAFISVWQTDLGAAGSTVIDIPTVNWLTYNYSIDWGDGFVQNNVVGAAQRTYAVAGTYTIKITGTFPQLYSDWGVKIRKLKAITSWGNIVWNSPDLTSSFASARNLLTLPQVTSASINNVVNGTYMFNDARGLTTLPIGFTFPQLGNGTGMFELVTLNTSRYSQLLIDMAAGNSKNNVTFHGGYSKYYGYATEARNALIARGWVITDGGIETLEQGVLFLDTFENGTDVWNTGGELDSSAGSLADSGTSVISTDFAFAGTRSLKMTSTHGLNQDGQTNNNRYTEPQANADLLYAFKLRIPTLIDVTPWSTQVPSSFINLMQYKGVGTGYNDPLWVWGLEPITGRGNGAAQLRFDLTFFGNLFPHFGIPKTIYQPTQIIGIPINQWVDIKLRYYKHPTNGIIELWQDGVKIYDLRNMPTDPSVRAGHQYIYWSVNNYANSTTPATYSLYVDDVKISIPNQETAPVINSTINTFDVNQLDPVVTATVTSTETNVIATTTVNTFSISQLSPTIAAVDSTPVFTSIWQTDLGSTGSNQISLPIVSWLTYNFTVDWGDGTSNLISATTDPALTHTYAAIGTYTIKITGTFPQLYSDWGVKIRKLKEITSWGNVQFSTDQSSSYAVARNLSSLPPVTPAVVNNVVSAFSMFHDCRLLTTLPNDMTFPALTDGREMFDLVTLNTTRYSQLLIDLNAGNPNNNVTFSGGYSKYNAAGQTARNALIARGWVITDGGLEGVTTVNAFAEPSINSFDVLLSHPTAYAEGSVEKPVITSIQNITPNQVRINWTSSTDPTGGFNPYRRVVGGEWVGYGVAGTERTFLLGNLLPATQYEFFVRYLNSDGNYTNSDIIPQTTLSA